VGDTLLWSERDAILGLDLRTGKERWKVAGGGGLRPVMIDGNAGALVLGARLRALDPQTGAVLAEGEFPLEDKRSLESTAVTDKNFFVTFLMRKGPKDSLGRVVAYRVADGKIEQAWVHEVQDRMEEGRVPLGIQDGCVYAAFSDKGLFVIDLETGKTVATEPRFTAGSNASLVLGNARMLWQAEGQHGRHHIQLAGLSGDHVSPLGPLWTPRHNDTTAYGQMPLLQILVDGRLIVRGMDGLYCYDLRAPRP
jgi:outer membrane protein assembly factor BamB